MKTWFIPIGQVTEILAGYSLENMELNKGEANPPVPSRQTSFNSELGRDAGTEDYVDMSREGSLLRSMLNATDATGTSWTSSPARGEPSSTMIRSKMGNKYKARRARAVAARNHRERLSMDEPRRRSSLES